VQLGRGHRVDSQGKGRGAEGFLSGSDGSNSPTKKKKWGTGEKKLRKIKTYLRGICAWDRGVKRQPIDQEMTAWEEGQEKGKESTERGKPKWALIKAFSVGRNRDRSAIIIEAFLRGRLAAKKEKGKGPPQKGDHAKHHPLSISTNY